jgi:hypothetical protein
LFPYYGIYRIWEASNLAMHATKRPQTYLLSKNRMNCR